jgi:hypothetical protein
MGKVVEKTIATRTRDRFLIPTRYSSRSEISPGDQTWFECCPTGMCRRSILIA